VLALAGLWLAVVMGRVGMAGRAYAGRVCRDRGRGRVIVLVPCLSSRLWLGCPSHPRIVSLPSLPILIRLCAYLVPPLSLYGGRVRGRDRVRKQ